MTEEAADLLHEIKNRYYRNFSILVNETLREAPEHLRSVLEVMLQESSSVYIRDGYALMKLSELRATMNEAERRVLQAALDQANGKPAVAAHSIGMRHQTFIWRLSKHPSIKRNEVKKRRQSIMKHKKRKII